MHKHQRKLSLRSYWLHTIDAICFIRLSKWQNRAEFSKMRLWSFRNGRLVHEWSWCQYWWWIDCCWLQSQKQHWGFCLVDVESHGFNFMRNSINEKWHAFNLSKCASEDWRFRLKQFNIPYRGKLYQVRLCISYHWWWLMKISQIKPSFLNLILKLWIRNSAARYFMHDNCLLYWTFLLHFYWWVYAEQLTMKRAETVILEQLVTYKRFLKIRSFFILLLQSSRHIFRHS